LGSTSHDGVSVYEKRYKTLKLHCDDAKKKFKEAGVDWKKDTVYFGMIDWWAKSSFLGQKFTSDHKIQFYVAAKKKRNDGGSSDPKDLPDKTLYTLIAPKNDFDGWYLDIDGGASSEPLKKWTVARNLLLTKEEGPEWRAVAEESED